MIPKNIPSNLMAFETIRHEEIKVFGKKIIVDTCKINNYYESMVMYPGGQEIDTEKTYNRTAALDAHERLLKKYTNEDGLIEKVNLSGKYLALQKAFCEAYAAAEKVSDIEDGGASNFDCMLIYLPVFEDRRSIIAAKKAGLSMTKMTFRQKNIWFVDPPFGGQGARRTAQAKAMYEAMKERGYMVDMYYEID